MTQASQARRQRRIQSERQNRRIDCEREAQRLVDVTAALEVAWDLSERAAIDMAIALLEATSTEPTKVPRGSKRRSGALVGYYLPYQTFAGRNSAVRNWLKAGAKADPSIALPIVLALLSRDIAELRGRIRTLLALPEPEARRVATRLLTRQ
jgi:hypothetical protein